MFGATYRKRLATDLDRWVADGLLTRSAADTMLADRRGQEQGGVLIALAFVVVILLAAGLIGFVAANWQQIPREVRVAGLMSTNLAVLAACLVFTLRLGALSLAVEASAALAVLSAAASISLIGQIYHLPANWPGFGLAMLAVAAATALVTRSRACIWLAAAAAIFYHGAAMDEAGEELLFRSAVADTNRIWPPYDVIVVGVSLLMTVSILAGWTGRAGAWTLFIALAPLFWVLGGAGLVPWAIGRPLACLAAAIAGAEILRRETVSWLGAKAIERLDVAVSAMLGLVVIALALLAAQHFEYRTAAGLPRLGISIWAAVPAVAFVLALTASAVWRDHGDRAALFWLAAALAAPFIADLVVDGGGGPSSRGSVGLARTATLVLLPLALLAVEARLSERHKTFAGCIIVMIAVVTERLWSTSDLMTFAGAMIGGGLVALAVLLAVRFLPARRRAAAPMREDA